MRTHALMPQAMAAGPARARGGSRSLPPPRYGLAAADRPDAAVQRKARIGAADSPLEHEADRVATAVMRGEPAGHISAATPGTPQRAEAEAGAATAAGHAVAGQGASPLGHGAALAPGVRSFFEARFGQDFGGVRIHADAAAGTQAAALQARAYTSGRDIVFGAGEYRPETPAGQQLLAHELAHTVQQSRGEPFIQRQIAVGAGLSLNTQGFSVTKSGDVYSAPKALRKGSVWNEIFTAMLASPRVFTLAGKTNAEVDASLLAHMKARLGIVQFAGNKKYGFGAGSDFKMNPDFWTVGPKGPEVRPDVDPRKALDDLNNPKNVGDPAHEYFIACHAATLLTMIGGSDSANLGETTSGDTTDWIPGDWGYVKNTAFPKKGGTPGYEGENLIYAGNVPGKGVEQFWGHLSNQLEYRTLQGWINRVNAFPKPTNAELQSVRRFTKVGLA